MSAYVRAANNSRHPCELPGCRYRRSFTSRFCARHRTRHRLYGHPQGRYVAKKEYAGYLAFIRRFFAEHPDHPALREAENRVRRLLAVGEQPCANRLDPHYQLWRELWRLQQSGVTCREALETAIAVSLLSYHDPRLLPDAARLTHALANAVFRLAPLDSVRGWDHVERKPWSVSRPPGALAVGLFGRRLLESLTPFVVNVVQSLEAAHAKRASDIRQPFVVIERPQCG